MKQIRSMALNTLRSAEKILMGLILGFASTSAMADQFYLIVGFECNSRDSELAVWFRGYENEEGERAISHLGKTSFYPRQLVTFSKNSDSKYAIKSKRVLRTCVLGRQKYSIEISPLMAPNFHPEGFCASRIGATVTVKENKKTRVTESFDACTDVGQMTTDFVVSPNRATTYRKIAVHDFLKQP